MTIAHTLILSTLFVVACDPPASAPASPPASAPASQPDIPDPGAPPPLFDDPNRWTVSAVPIHACFSPNGGCEQLVVDAIGRARESLDVAIYSLTDPAIATAITSAVSRGVKVRIIADQTEAAGKSSLVKGLKHRGIPTEIRRGIGRGIMHNKVAIIDSRWVISGSLNWTLNAMHFNAENALIIDDSVLARCYAAEFERIWESGVTSHGVDDAKGSTAR